MIRSRGTTDPRCRRKPPRAEREAPPNARPQGEADEMTSTCDPGHPLRGTEMRRTIGPVQPTEYGYEFILYDDEGRPCASFVYPDEPSACQAAKLMSDALMVVGTIRGLIVPPP
jgi:hypothetical protein